jgi:hypothetical protein
MRQRVRLKSCCLEKTIGLRCEEKIVNLLAVERNKDINQKVRRGS